jgi:hypothetical protein
MWRNALRREALEGGSICNLVILENTFDLTLPSFINFTTWK